MVPEAEPSLPLPDALPDMHGYRVDLRFRLANDQRSPDCQSMEEV